METADLLWLHSGLYRLLFGTSLSTALVAAEEVLVKVKSQQVVDTAATKLESIIKLVMGAAVELSGASLLWQWCWQLMLLPTIKEMLRCCRSLENSLPAPRTGSVRDAPGSVQYKLQEICWGDLTVVGTLGSGSFGTVFSAWWRGALVAVKCVEGGIDSSKQQILLEMEEEAKMMAVKNHPNVVRFLAVCREKPAIIMELCTAGSIDKQIQRHLSLSDSTPGQSATAAAAAAGKLEQQEQQQLITPLRVIKIMHDVAAAMDYLHTVSAYGARSAVLHCDLRSPNLLLAGNSQRPEDWSVRVADFGLARWVGPDGGSHTDMVTNHLWVAPEVLEGRAAGKIYHVSRASDVYSFGAVMWELLTGRLPHVDSNMAPRQVEALGAGNPCAMKGPLQWPTSEQFLPGLDCSLVQQLQPLFERCVSTDMKYRPSFERIQEQLADVLIEVQAANTAAAQDQAGALMGEAQWRGPPGVCQASLGPVAPGLSPAESVAAANAQAAYLEESPFAAIKDQYRLATGTVHWSPFLEAAVN